MMERLFQFFKLDWNQFRILLAVSIRLDFRGSRGLGKHRRMSPILGSLIFYWFMGTFLAGSLVSRTTPFLFSLLTISYSMVMIVFAVLLELENIIFNPEDDEVLIHLPINSRTYFLARYFNFLFFVTLMSTALCLMPSFLGILVQESKWMYPIVFLPVSLFANLVAAAFVIFIYTYLIEIMSYERFKDALAYFQIGFAFVIFFVYQLIPRMSQEFIQRGTSISETWLLLIPPAWFAGSVQVMLGLGLSMELRLAVLAVIAVAFFILFSFRWIFLQYDYYIVKHREDSKFKKRKEAFQLQTSCSGFIGRCIGKMFPFMETRAGYYFASRLIKNDRSVKLGIYPVFGIPLALMALAIIERDLVDPFVIGLFSGEASLSMMVVFFIFFMIYFSLIAVTYSRDWEAAWIYYITPIVSLGRFYQGIKLAILVKFILPFFILLGTIYCTQIPFTHAIKHTISIFFSGLVVLSAFSFTVKDFPFSRKRERGERMQRFSFFFLVIPFFGVLLLIQSLAYRSDLGWGFTLGGFYVLFFVLESLAIKRLNRVLMNMEFLA